MLSSYRKCIVDDACSLHALSLQLWTCVCGRSFSTSSDYLSWLRLRNSFKVLWDTARQRALLATKKQVIARKHSVPTVTGAVFNPQALTLPKRALVILGKEPKRSVPVKPSPRDAVACILTVANQVPGGPERTYF